jgi:Uma2 family endonuclease
MAINVRVGMPLADFIAETNEQSFELINGERIAKMPSVAVHNEVLHRLFLLLNAFIQARNLGFLRMEATFVLPDRYDAEWVTGSRTPDLMFIGQERIERYWDENPDWREKPYLIAPDFVAEIVSPNDKFSAIDEKVDAYLADGVRLVWVIDPKRKKAFIYTPDDAPQVVKATGMLDAEDVMPGFTAVLADLFV